MHFFMASLRSNWWKILLIAVSFISLLLTTQVGSTKLKQDSNEVQRVFRSKSTKHEQHLILRSGTHEVTEKATYESTSTLKR